MIEEINSYLWDATGEPDPSVIQLERVLSEYRHVGKPLRVEHVEVVVRRSSLRLLVPIASALAACALLVLGISTWRLKWTPDAPWRISTLRGAPSLNGAAIGESGEFGVGQVLETDGNSTAEVRVARIGTMRVDPGSRVELISTGARKHKIALTRGKISAQLWAPPWSLEMETPSAMAFDLGCKFTLEVMPDGSGLMSVSSGWVELESQDFQTLVPAGALAATRKGFAPGSPYFEDASDAFKSALDELNFASLDAAHRAAALQTVILAARAKDVVTLFNLMARADRDERSLLYDRAVELDPPPVGVTREGILAWDQPMMNRWWRTLGFGDAKRWWIHWQDAF